MKIKDRIQADFINAMKSRNEIAKLALSTVKAKITEAEKAIGSGNELSESDIIKVINKAIKQREESAEIYKKAGRDQLAERELSEIDVLIEYMPVQMTEEEIEASILQIIKGINHDGNINKLIGQTMGAFNKNHQGRADNKLVSEVIKRVINFKN
jgi:uncharacterized protein